MTQFYLTPPGDILSEPPPGGNDCEYYTPEYIMYLLNRLGCPVTVEEVITAPQVVSYGCNLIDFITANRLKSYLSALSMELRLGKDGVILRNSDKYSFWLTVCRLKPSIAYFRDCLLTKRFNGAEGALKALLGISADGDIISVDIAKLPHLLIAGTTGSGKSVALNSILSSLLFTCTPAQLKLVMVDTKQVELPVFNSIPHMLADVAKDFNTALHYVKWLCDKLDERNARLAEMSLRKIAGSNMDRIILVIDELADLLGDKVNREIIEPYLIRLVTLGRSAGIHCIFCSQKPTAACFSTTIKSNCPARIAFQVTSIRDSQVILDYKSAEQLRGRGDGIYKSPESPNLIRFQGAYISDEDVGAIIKYWKNDCYIEG